MKFEEKEKLVNQFDNETEAMEVAVMVLISKNDYFKKLREWASNRGGIRVLAEDLYYFYYHNDVCMDLYSYLDKYEDFWNDNVYLDININKSRVGDVYDCLCDEGKFTFKE